jgi:hypothetical protein
LNQTVKQLDLTVIDLELSDLDQEGLDPLWQYEVMPGKSPGLAVRRKSPYISYQEDLFFSPSGAAGPSVG